MIELGLLARNTSGVIRNVEILNGFMTALVLCPDLFRPSEHLKVITSGQDDNGDLVFDSLAQAERFYALLMRHWNTINKTLREGPTCRR